MPVKYVEPQITVFKAEEKDNILLGSDVTIDVDPLYGDDINNLLN